MKLPFARIPQAVETAGRLTSGKAFGLAKGPLLGPSIRLETIMESNASATHREPWNKAKIVGQNAVQARGPSGRARWPFGPSEHLSSPVAQVGILAED